ncbi:hypothetical protein [Reyranella sp.]|uniref:hypothetical protein n=1 Tax=Reyranella sp. TaxID=1929291 RepID=UPI000BCB36D5|nr:hypothetical protein [Reyranella sp.]OYY34447.1 MAG: hypothetical protein B7Y57_28075 [Rhodospirillales bacterium 35-66-84]OYZ91015.1 MAG: hypothetical protein B7Y08_27980 [Rhodospirillales bacterium 24-66-33]OZB21511.1 MAG: hypothetical protein B7X63_27075 [Rhodospirillales bacterium 39-66-50]HQS18588.1 hypothetical protein [Reyranella sp.]HQT15409.1 hypothetical protein [Reyranella sp.]
MFVYSLMAIDFWSGWKSEDDHKKELVAQANDLHEAAASWDLFLLFKRKAFDLAKKVGWEGDIRSGNFFVSGLPAEGASEIMIAWKQDNNGQTFVASPFALPWLDAEDKIEG